MASTPILCTDSIAQWQSVHILSGGARVRFPADAVQYLAFGEKYWDVMYDQHTHIMYRFHNSMVECPHSIGGARVRFQADAVQYLAFGEKYWDVMYDQHTHIIYRFHSSMVERPHSIRGAPGSIPRRCSSIFGIWREVLGRNVYITSQYFFPAIIYRDIISHITSTYRDMMYFFRTFKKSTAPYKVHNMGLQYIIIFNVSKFLSPLRESFLSSRNIFPLFAKIAC